MVYLDCGTAGVDGQLITGYERMHEALKEKGMREGKNLLGFLDTGAEHTESAWAKRLWRPLEFLFPAPRKEQALHPQLSR